jgi:HD-GYP domain-containing protein (c-di-GMP phosphodiesterase class II)
MQTISLWAVLKTLGRACDLAAARPYGFSQRVARAALWMAEELGLPDEVCGDLLIAALCHSAGVAGVCGDLSRVLRKDERETLRLYPAEHVFALLDAAEPSVLGRKEDELQGFGAGAFVDPDSPNTEDGLGDRFALDPEDEGERTGIFLRHYTILERFPALTGAWLARAGLGRAGEVAAGMFDPWARAGRAAPYRLAAAVLGAAYHLVAMRWLAMSEQAPEQEMAQRAFALLGQGGWVEVLEGSRLSRGVVEAAASLWEEQSFWEEMEGARTSAWFRPAPDAPAPGADLAPPQELGADVPDVQEAVERLLGPVYGERLSLDAPTLVGWFSLLGAMVDRKMLFDDGHSARVSNLSGELALLLGLDDAQVQEVRLAAWLYGVGRLGLPSALVESPSLLDHLQRAILHTSPGLVRGLLEPLSSLGGLVEAASCHAERLDGSGVPEGRASARIPMGGRVLAVVDTFEALVSERPYRPAHARARALHILQAQSGRLFDGVVTDALEGLARGEL